MLAAVVICRTVHGSPLEVALFCTDAYKMNQFGAVPLAFGTGTGSELRHPLGVSIVGGLLVSQMITLLTTPVIYLYLDRFRRRPHEGGERRRRGVVAALAGVRERRREPPRG